MNKMILLSSLFISSKNLSKEVEQEEERRSSETPRKFQEKKDLLIRFARSIHEEHSKSSSHGYVHSAISPKLQGSINNFFMKRKKEGMILFDALPRARSPLNEGNSSQEGSMEIPPSLDDQDLRYIFDDEVISVIGEEEKTGGHNGVTTKTPQTPHEDETGALAPREETLAHLQGVPQDLTHRALE